MSYKIINIVQDGKMYDITKLFSSIRWGGDIRETARYLEVSLLYTNDYYTQRYNVPLGSTLILYNDEKEIVRTVVFSTDRDTNETLMVKGYDHLIYLLKSQITKVITKMTASQFIKIVCGEFGIPVGEIVETGVPLTKIYRDKSIYDAFISALTDTTLSNGKKYALRMKEGKLTLFEKAKQTVRWKIEDGVNLSRASYSESIEDMKNKIVLLGENDKVVAEVKDDKLISLYGILQEQRSYDKETDGELKTFANNLLKELGRVSQQADVDCLGIDDVEAGCAIELENNLLGLIGTFYVESDDHTVQNDVHTMNLRLNLTDEVDTASVESAARKKKKKTQASAELNWNFNW